ncbi:MAG: DMT family transporter [Burkholderiaceae bacterium]|nr:DMT family transporter [Burkholderiaceae bacterium]
MPASAPPQSPPHPHLAPIGALLLNATVWGLSWIPFRALDGLGVHSLWTTTWIYALSGAMVLARYPGALAQVFASRWLVLLALASGLTNACFNWGVTVGEVVRVVLLFYLMPVWAALFARALLGERTGAGAAARIALALAGAFVVLWQADGMPGLPSSLADWLGVAGGAAFALTNVLLRRQAADPPQARALAMFAGGVVVPGALAVVLSWGSATGASAGEAARAPAELLAVASATSASWPVLDATTAAIATVTAALFLASNLALQYGAARLPSSVTAVVMLSEVVVAAVSAALLGNEALGARTLAGGAMIVAASLLSAFPRPPFSRRRSGGEGPGRAPRPPGRA